MKASLRRLLPPSLHGTVIDAIFIVLNLSILPFIGSGIEDVFGESFQEEADESAMMALSIVVSVAFFLRIVGLYLKRFPLQARKSNLKGNSLINSLWFIHIGLTALSSAIIIVAIIFSLKNAGFGDLTKNRTVTDVLIPITVISVIFFEIFLLFIWLKDPLSKRLEEKRKRQNWRFSPITELFADFGLFVYMFVWQAFFGYFAALIITENLFHSIGTLILGFIMLILAFTLFYLPPRTVFLIEDAKYKSTWIGISLVFLTAILSNILWGFVLNS